MGRKIDCFVIVGAKCVVSASGTNVGSGIPSGQTEVISMHPSAPVSPDCLQFGAVVYSWLKLLALASSMSWAVLVLELVDELSSLNAEPHGAGGSNLPERRLYSVFWVLGAWIAFVISGLVWKRAVNSRRTVPSVKRDRQLLSLKYCTSNSNSSGGMSARDLWNYCK